MDLDHDPRWIREGKPLREWLWMLASPVEAIWRTASEPLNSMRYGLSPELPAPRGTREYNDRRAVFEQVVVALLEDSSFRAAEWVTAMLASFRSLYVECFAD